MADRRRRRHPSTALFNDRFLARAQGLRATAELPASLWKARLNGGIRNMLRIRRTASRRIATTALSGAKPMARSVSTPTRPWSPPSGPFLRALLRWPGAPRLAMALRPEGLTFPLQMHQGADIRWVEASQHRHPPRRSHQSRPCRRYACGKSRRETMLNPSGVRESASENRLAPSGRCLFRDHHPGFIIGDLLRPTRIASPKNTRAPTVQSSVLVREGSSCCKALLLPRTADAACTRIIGDDQPCAGISPPRQDPGRGLRASIASMPAASRFRRGGHAGFLAALELLKLAALSPP